MSKHTPGPWRVDDGAPIHKSHVRDASGEVIATAYCGGVGCGGHAIDNATLISAAPDLLAVAEDAYRTAGQMGWADKMLLWGAAIARARGDK